jgi:hypothetical protein
MKKKAFRPNEESTALNEFKESIRFVEYSGTNKEQNGFPIASLVSDNEKNNQHLTH